MSEAVGSLGPGRDVERFRSAVAGLIDDVRAVYATDDKPGVEKLLIDRLDESDLRTVAALNPGGAGAVTEGVLREVGAYVPSSRSSASDLPSLVRIYLLSQIDAAWWAAAPRFETDDDVVGSADLVDLDVLRRRGLLRFNYRRQPKGIPGRGRDWAERRLAPHRRPHTSGLRFTQTRPESVALLNRVAEELSTRAPAGTPSPWVTSLVRSIEHQHRLRQLGYAAVLPSAHCCGFAMDVEIRWFRRFGADGLLTGLLLELQGAGLVNVIDEGQAWHVCISPSACTDLQATYRHLVEA